MLGWIAHKVDRRGQTRTSATTSRPLAAARRGEASRNGSGTSAAAFRPALGRGDGPRGGGGRAPEQGLDPRDLGADVVPLGSLACRVVRPGEPGRGLEGVDERCLVLGVDEDACAGRHELGWPADAVATTDRPQAIASSVERPNGSTRLG